MSYLPSASPPAVHHEKNSKGPVALASGLMFSAASSVRLSVAPAVPPVVAVAPAAMASVAVGSAAAMGVSVAAAAAGAAGVSGAAAGRGVVVAVSVPHAASKGIRITSRTASHAKFDFNRIIIVFLLWFAFRLLWV